MWYLKYIKYLECEIPDKVAYIIPIGDLHVGDKSFGKEGRQKLQGYLDWVKARPNARIFLNGDIFNVASRISKTDPWSQDTNEYLEAIEIFKPYAAQIIGATDGNHEARMIDMFGVSPMQYFCLALKVPYCKWSAMVRLKVGARKGGWRQNYFLYFHHTTGGGGTIGSKLNRVSKLREIAEGIDVFFGSHNHQLAVAPQDVYYPSIQKHEAVKRRIWYVDCGSYLEWNDSYAEKGMMSPTKLGSPRVRFDGGQKHDVHCSL